MNLCDSCKTFDGCEFQRPGRTVTHCHQHLPITRADLKRGGVVVPDDEFTLDLDTQKGSDPCITISSKKNGVGYELVRGSIDGHFSRRTYNITPYMRHCLDTIGIHPIPADRVLGEGEEKIRTIVREAMDAELEYRRAFCDEAPDDVLDHLWDAFDALRAQATQEPAT